MKRKVKIGEVIFTVLFVLVLVFVLSIVFKLASGQTPTVLGYSALFVETDSMEPEIPAKTLILVKERDFEKQPPTRGEVVCFHSDKWGVLITHRVIDVGTDYVITQGDNAAGNDGEIELTDIKFSYVSNLPFLSGVANVIRQTWGFIVFVIIPCLCVIGLLVFNMYKSSVALAKQKKQAEEDNRIEEIKKQAIENYLKNQEQTIEDNLQNKEQQIEGNIQNKDKQ